MDNKLSEQVLAWLEQYKNNLPQRAINSLRNICGISDNDESKRSVTLVIKGKEYIGEFINEAVDRFFTGHMRRIPTKVKINEKLLDVEGQKFFISWFKEVMDGTAKLKRDYAYVVPYKVNERQGGTLHGCFIIEHMIDDHFILTFDFMDARYDELHNINCEPGV